MQIHERLKAARIDKAIKQEDAAKALNTIRQQIYRYESGTNDITATKLRDLCLYYNVSADYILGLPRGMDWPSE